MPRRPDWFSRRRGRNMSAQGGDSRLHRRALPQGLTGNEKPVATSGIKSMLRHDTQYAGQSQFFNGPADALPTPRFSQPRLASSGSSSLRALWRGRSRSAGLRNRAAKNPPPQKTVRAPTRTTFLSRLLKHRGTETQRHRGTGATAASVPLCFFSSARAITRQRAPRNLLFT